MLIRADTPEPVLARIVESEEMPPDGEIFRKILLNRRLHEELSENQWWAYIDNSKPKDLRQLLKNRPLATAFESLVDMPGLWAKLGDQGAAREIFWGMWKDWHKGIHGDWRASRR